MLHTTTEIEYRTGAAAPLLPTIAGAEVADAVQERRSRLTTEQALDQVLADSFPASDPPSWNPGIALLAPGVATAREARSGGADGGVTGPATDTVAGLPSSRTDRTFLQGLASLAGAIGLVLLVPFVILLVGLPIALSLRGALELFSLLLGVVLR